MIRHQAVQAFFQTLLDRLQQGATGSATRVARLHVMAAPPSLDLGEVTDKGSINQRAVLTHRAEWVEALHAGEAPHMVMPQPSSAIPAAPEPSQRG